MDRELWKKTFVTVAAMLGAWLVVVGGLTAIAVVIASHAVAPASSSDHETAPAANAETQQPASPVGGPARARNVPAPAKGREAI